MRRPWVGVSGVAVGAVLLAVLAVNVGAGCNEPPETLYGNPNGLDRKNLPGEGGAEPLVCGGDAGGACPSFAEDIFPNMAPSGKFRCSDSTCHGGAMTPPLDGTSAGALLASLRAITVAGKPYVTGDPADTAILCNLQGICGSRMPKPPGVEPTPEELCLIDTWLKCGAPP